MAKNDAEADEPSGRRHPSHSFRVEFTGFCVQASDATNRLKVHPLTRHIAVAMDSCILRILPKVLNPLDIAKYQSGGLHDRRPGTPPRNPRKRNMELRRRITHEKLALEEAKALPRGGPGMTLGSMGGRSVRGGRTLYNYA